MQLQTENRPKTLVAFTGLPRSGKDTAAAYLVKNYGFTRIAFADPLKRAAAILLNRYEWEMRGDHGFDREAILPEWGFTTRDFLQRFGTEAMRNNFGADFWVRHMRTRLRPGARYAITDCRFPNEVNLVRDLGGVVVRVVRPGCVGSSHVSDQPVSCDAIIVNDGDLQNLYTQLEFTLIGLTAKNAQATRPAG